MREIEKDFFVKIREYKKGETIYRQGEKAEEVFLLKSGKVGIYIDGQYISEISEPNSVLGETSALFDRPRSVTAIALEDTQLIVLPNKYLDNIIKENPQIALNIARMLTARLRQAVSQIAVLHRQLNECRKQVEELKTEKETIKTGKIAEILVRSGMITPKQLEEALKIQKKYEKEGKKKSIGEILLSKGYITMFQLIQIYNLEKSLERNAEKKKEKK